MKQVLAISLLVCTSLTARAEWYSLERWGAVFGTSGYQGQTYIGAGYFFPESLHRVEMSLGASEGIYSGPIYQLNFKYYYEAFQTNVRQNRFEFRIGGLLTRCLCDEVFVESLDVYPERNYYDMTAYRFAVMLNGTFRFKNNIQFFTEFSLLDQIIIAAYNNRNMRHYPLTYWSLGWGLILPLELF